MDTENKIYIIRGWFEKCAEALRYQSEYLEAVDDGLLVEYEVLSEVLKIIDDDF